MQFLYYLYAQSREVAPVHTNPSSTLPTLPILHYPAITASFQDVFSTVSRRMALDFLLYRADASRKNDVNDPALREAAMVYFGSCMESTTSFEMGASSPMEAFSEMKAILEVDALEPEILHHPAAASPGSILHCVLSPRGLRLALDFLRSPGNGTATSNVPCKNKTRGTAQGAPTPAPSRRFRRGRGHRQVVVGKGSDDPVSWNLVFLNIHH